MITKFHLLRICLLVSFVCWISCQPKFVPLPEKRITQLLLEMHLAESYAQRIPQADSLHAKLNNEDSLKLFYAQLLKKNNLTEKEFIANMKWYAQYPTKLDSIYQNILNDLSIKQVKQD